VGLNYTFSKSSDTWLKGIVIGLNAQNIFARDPPWVADRAAQIGYDQENGDLNGRVIRATIRKDW
jgi:outer membrane receptor protein involved in Fe transport